MSRKSTETASVDHCIRGEVVVAHVRGEFDVNSRDMLSSALDQMAATGKHLVIKLDELEFMDIGTASLFQRTAEQLAGRGQSVTVVDPSPIVRRLLILLGMDGLLEGARRIPQPRFETG